MTNWAIMGPGGIANKFAQALMQCKDARLIGCASKSIEKAQEFKKAYDLKYAYGSYNELVANNEIDAVYVSTTHNFHYECAKTALLAGKHTVVEKAFTVNAAQAQELVDIATEKNVFLMEAMWTRFLPAFKWAKDMVLKGEIGDLQNVTASLCVDFPYEPSSRIFNINLAGGGLLDVGIYNLSIACFFLGCDPAKIQSSGSIGKTGVDENVSVILSYEKGRTATLNHSIIYKTKNDVYIHGTKGYIHIPSFVDAQAAQLVYNDGKSAECNTPHDNGFIYEVEEINSLIKAGKKESHVITHDDTVKIIKICDKLRADWGLVFPGER